MSQPCAGRPLGELRVREERGRVCSGNRGPVGRWGDLQAWSVAQEGWGVPQGLGRVCGSRRHGQIWFSQLAPATGWGTHTGHARAERRARQPRGSGGLAGEQRREGVGAGWGRTPGAGGGSAGRGRERGTQAWRLEAPWRPRGDRAGAAGERGPRPARAISLEPAPGGTGPEPSCPRRPRPVGGRAAGVWKKGVKAWGLRGTPGPQVAAGVSRAQTPGISSPGL